MRDPHCEVHEYHMGDGRCTCTPDQAMTTTPNAPMPNPRYDEKCTVCGREWGHHRRTGLELRRYCPGPLGGRRATMFTPPARENAGECWMQLILGKHKPEEGDEMQIQIAGKVGAWRSVDREWIGRVSWSRDIAFRRPLTPQPEGKEPPHKHKFSDSGFCEICGHESGASRVTNQPSPSPTPQLEELAERTEGIITADIIRLAEMGHRPSPFQLRARIITALKSAVEAGERERSEAIALFGIDPAKVRSMTAFFGGVVKARDYLIKETAQLAADLSAVKRERDELKEASERLRHQRNAINLERDEALASVSRLQAACGEKGRALREADKFLTTIRNAPGNTLNPLHISQEAYRAHEMVKAAVAPSGDTSPTPRKLTHLEQIEECLRGIDETEMDTMHGWWETSEGAAFGKCVLERIREILRTSQPAPTPHDLDAAGEEIRVVCRKYDIAALVTLQAPGKMEWVRELNPTWSCVKIAKDEQGRPHISFSVVNLATPPASEEERKHAIVQGVGMLMGFQHQANCDLQMLEPMIEDLAARMDIQFTATKEPPRA
jgi:hypothetical protein